MVEAGWGQEGMMTGSVNSCLHTRWKLLCATRRAQKKSWWDWGEGEGKGLWNLPSWSVSDVVWSFYCVFPWPESPTSLIYTENGEPVALMGFESMTLALCVCLSRCRASITGWSGVLLRDRRGPGHLLPGTGPFLEGHICSWKCPCQPRQTGQTLAPW